MGSKTADEKYTEIMRKKNGQERLKIAMELRQLVLNIAKEGIKYQCPNISSKDLKANLQQRIYGFSFPFKNSGRKIR